MRLGRGWLGQRPLQSQMSSHNPHTGTRIINYSFSSTAARGTLDGLLPSQLLQHLSFGAIWPHLVVVPPAVTLVSTPLPLML